ncbi:MAG TPA: hypothetical protein VFR41_09470, partial [Acidimicrobiia bacterium]|nr:hypothetical protein [Acidimicrobiia bacterium]
MRARARVQKFSSRRLLLTASAILIIAITVRSAGHEKALATSIATCIALAAFAAGLWLHCRSHRRAWRVAWSLLGLALAVQTLATTLTAAGRWPTAYPAPIDNVGAIGALAAAMAFAILLSTRLRGKAVDALLEGSIIAASSVSIVWTWAVARGISSGHALTVLTPV